MVSSEGRGGIFLGWEYRGIQRDGCPFARQASESVHRMSPRMARVRINYPKAIGKNTAVR